MADKKLLEESTIRRFMELANIKPSEQGVLTENVGRSGVSRPQAGGDHKLANGGTPAMTEKKKHPVKKDQGKMEETTQEEAVEEGLEEYATEEGMGGYTAEADEAPEMAGDEMGAESEGGDLEAAVEQLVSAMNGVLAAAGMSDKTVELDSGEGEEGGEEEMPSDEDEAGGADDAMDDSAMMEASDKEEKMEEGEDLEESIELVDDTLVEKLLQRVSARLVAEARKSRELAESKKGWGKVASKAASHKSSTKGKGAGKGTPFTRSVSVKGTAGRK